MPRLKNSFPKYRLHKSSGHARVQLGAREFFLGPYDSEESRQRYNLLLGQWLAAGRPTHWEPDSEFDDQQPQPRIISVTEIVVRYVEYLHERWPAPKGKKNSKQVTDRINMLRRFRARCGPMPGDSFGPLALHEYRKYLISLDHSRRYVNMQVCELKRMFKWAVSQELFPAGKWQALTAIEGLRAGESGVRESEAVEPVGDEAEASSIRAAGKGRS